MFITDSDGMSTLTLFNNAASRILPKPERQVEETPMATGSNIPSLDDPWSNADHWNVLAGGPPIQQQQQFQQPQQQPSPIVHATADAGNPLSLPKDQETLSRMIQTTAQQTMMNTLGSLANINQQKNQTLDSMKRKFAETPGYAPWIGAFENNFNKMINQGYDIETAKKMSIDHVGEMSRMGFKPPENKVTSIPSSGYRGGNLAPHQLRSDEDGGGTTHFTDEDKEKVREDWINRRNVAADYVKSGGINGMSYQDMYPAAFNRGRTDLIISKK